MNRQFRHGISLGLALVALGWASGALAQSTADGKRTLKAEKLFYKQAGMMEVTLRAMRGTLMMTGYVPLDEQLKKADELAGKVKGIKDIRNRIRVREPDVASAPDDHIPSGPARCGLDSRAARQPRERGGFQDCRCRPYGRSPCGVGPDT